MQTSLLAVEEEYNMIIQTEDISQEVHAHGYKTITRYTR